MFSSRRKRAFLLTELVVAMAVLGILMVGMAVTLYGVRRFHHVLWFRQQCMAAAQAQIDSLMATGLAIEPNRIATLWPRLKVETQIRPGQGPWQGLDLVQATASGPRSRRVVTVTLARYGTIPKRVARDEWFVTDNQELRTMN
jgi:type II secretory pathway pseudopilin PulG